MRKNLREMKKNNGNNNEEQGSKSIDLNTSDRQLIGLQVTEQDADQQDESNIKKKKGKAT